MARQAKGEEMSEDLWAHAVEYIGIYATAGSALFGFAIVVWKKVLKPMTELFKRYRESMDKIDTIFGEVTPNGGSSIKDSIRRIEHEVALSRERFKATHADSDAAMFETDAEGNCLWVNRTYCRITERSPDQLLGKGWINAICPGVRENTISEFQRAVDEDREMTNLDSEFITPDGVCVNITCNTYKMRNHKGKTLGYLGVCIPVGKKANEHIERIRVGLEE